MSHPTADELYARVRKRLPRISLATVYRNLEMLSDNGVIQELDTTGKLKRFDGDPSKHTHIVCVNCGKVDDIEYEGKENPFTSIRSAGGYKVLKFRIEFDGVCPECEGSS